jgi:quinol monooxygenase YgiN
MIIVTYTYHITPEQVEEYLKTTKERIKPFWEGKGCRYEVYQDIESPTSFLKIMAFEDEVSLKRNLFEKGEESTKVVKLFRSFAHDVKRLIYKKATCCAAG